MCWRAAALICLLCFAIPVITQDVQATAATATTSGEGVIAGAAEGQTGQALDDAIEANSEAQDYNEETLPVTAQIVKEEPAIEIASGTGDIDTTGRESSTSCVYVNSLIEVRLSQPTLPELYCVRRQSTPGHSLKTYSPLRS